MTLDNQRALIMVDELEKATGKTLKGKHPQIVLLELMYYLIIESKKESEQQ